ncbi:MAG TPA: AAA family ATPase [Tepidisphaeraceae bacterium]|nr:AAA family ATPase [Tepidisphaeraceae bacterium]
MGRRKPPHIIVVAGPNGAGKTTFARQYLPREGNCPDFINVDLIAQGLSPFAPEKSALRAGRVMLAEIRRRVANRESFAFETTLSGLNYAKHIQRWRSLGYQVKIIFLQLPAIEMAIERVRARVRQGGHPVEELVIRRRYIAGLKNFQNVYCKLANRWELYDNSLAEPRLISAGENL